MLKRKEVTPYVEINPKEKVALFLRVGIVVLSCLVIIGLGMNYLPKVIDVVSFHRDKSIPVYALDTEEKVVALSFDAAWGNGHLGYYIRA